MADTDTIPEEFHADHPSENGSHEDTELQENVTSPDVLPSENLPTDSASASHEEDASSPETVLEVAPSSKEPASAPKSPVKVPTGKATSSAVKKILNSGTFGAGAAKPSVSKITAPSAKPTGISSPIKKTASGPPLTKSAMPPKVPVSAVPPPSRRTSIAPRAPAGPPVRAPVTSSTATKPASRLSIAPSPDSAANMKSSATARPRASVSEGVKRTVSVTKPTPGNRPPSTTATRPATRTPGAGSISSIKEVKDDGKAAELQQKLDEATASLSSRDASITELESQVTEAKLALDAALADLETKRSTLDELEQAKTATELKLKDAQDILQAVKAERDGDDSTALIEAVQTELQQSKSALIVEKEAIEQLQAQVTTLEAEVASTRAELEVLRVSNQAASGDAAAAAAIEHEALVKAKADFNAIKAETESLTVAHSKALEEATSKIQSLECKAITVDTLEGEVATLKREKEDSANRISELEIEVLEAKESLEQAEDHQAKASAQAKSLQEELSKAVAALGEELKTKETEYANQVEATKLQHGHELNTLKAEQESLLLKLSTLEADLADAQSSLEKAQFEHLASVDEHTMHIQSLEKTSHDKLAELDVELQRVSKELEDQEKIYNAKVDVVKEEHEQHLQEAFQRAGDEHGVDLQALRAESQASIEQVRSSHETTIQNLRVEHAAALDEQTKTLEKQIAIQNVELKATHDDLVKAKSALATALQEVESIKSQLEEARKTAESIASTTTPDQSALMARLQKEISNSMEDQEALKEVLAAQNESFAEMSDNHAKELEEAAKGRAEEFTKLRAAHEAEKATFSKEKSELATKLSDLEGELATLKANLGAEPVSAPKANGATQASSGITKEELQRMHEAHNLKMGDMQAEFEKTLRALKEDLDSAQNKSSELELEVNRKGMEINYLESDQEDQATEITRLKEDLESLRDQLRAKE